MRMTALSLALALAASELAAQSTPVVLVHGFASDSSTWSPMAASLIGTSYYQPYAPSLTWANAISSQASQLDSYMAGSSLPSATYIMAHSMGGLTSRAMSRFRSLNSIMTIGTPHGGATVANMASAVSAKQAEAASAFLCAAGTLGDFVLYGNHSDPLYSAAASGLNHVTLAFVGWSYAAAFAGSLGYAAQASLTDLAPGSSFLSTLNSTESSISLTHKQSFEVQLTGGYYGGPAALFLSATDADDFGLEIQQQASFAAFDAMGLLFDGDDSDLSGTAALIGSGCLEEFAWSLSSFSDWWTYLIVGGYPHDGLIPTGSQHYPTGATGISTFGRHTTETVDGISSMIGLLNSWTGH